MYGSLLCLAASGAYGFWRMVRVEAAENAAPHVRVGIAQPNVGEIDLHANPYLSVRTLWSQTAELHGRAADLVVWPEGGFTLPGVAAADNDRRDIRRPAPPPT